MSRGSKIVDGIVLLMGLCLSVYMMVQGLLIHELPLRVTIFCVALGVFFLALFVAVGIRLLVRIFRK